MAFLFAILRGVLEFGWVLSGIHAGLPVYVALCSALAFRLGSLFASPVSLGRRLTCIAGGAAAVFAAAVHCLYSMGAPSYLLQCCTIFLLSAGMNSIRRSTDFRSLRFADLYVILGLALCPLAMYFPSEILMISSSAVMLGAFRVPDKRPRFIKFRVRCEQFIFSFLEHYRCAVFRMLFFAAAVLMLQEYAAAVLVFANAASCTATALRPYMFTNKLTAYMSCHTYAFLCLTASIFFEPGLLLFSMWIYGSVANNTTTLRNSMDIRNSLRFCTSDHAGRNTGDIMGVLTAILLSVFPGQGAALDVGALISGVIALVLGFTLSNLVIRRLIDTMVAEGILPQDPA